MPISPDLVITPATDLRIFDRSPNELVERALLDATTKMPGWVPKAGNTEVVLLEAVSLVTSEAVFAIDRVLPAATENVLALFGIERSDGVAATATATFTFVDTAGHTVLAGALLRLDLGAGSWLLFTTDVDATAGPAVDTATVAITAIEGTDVANGTAIGTALTPMESSTFVESVELATAVAGGASPEDTETFVARAIQEFALFGRTLVDPLQFTAFAITDVRVSRATTLNLHDGTTTANGHVAVAVGGIGGVALSSGVKTEIEDAMQAKAQANLIVHVIDPTVTTVSVVVSVTAVEGFTAAEVKAAIVEAVTAYLNPDLWPWGGTVYRNELIALIDGVAGVDRVVTLTSPAADTALSGVAPLADTDIDTADITVV